MNCGNISVPEEFIRNSDGTYNYKGYTIIKIHSSRYRAIKEGRTKILGKRLSIILRLIDDREG